jgi:hypothetical protein
MYQWREFERIMLSVKPIQVNYEDPGTSFCSTSKTDHHDIAEILLNVALNNITLTLTIVILIS